MDGEKELIEIQLLTPLTAEFYRHDNYQTEDDYYYDEDGECLTGYDLIQFEPEISEAITERNQNVTMEGRPFDLMDYYDRNQSIKDKINSAEVSVKIAEGALWGCTTLQLRELLDAKEMNEFCSYISGQYSDGWGEGFEQKDIEVDGGYLNVHFYQAQDFQFREMPREEKTSQESKAPDPVKKKPKMELLGHDGNIFSILGRAKSLLVANGQKEEAKEMQQRVFESADYAHALGVVSEYVDTELSQPQRSGTPSKGKRKEETR